MAWCRGWCAKHYKRWLSYGSTEKPPATASVHRFMAKVNETDSCWIWTAALDPYGYGRFWANGGMVLAHRWAYEHFVGPIPAGLVVDHLCSNPPCVNPAHLDPCTQAENVRRGESGARQAAITQCPRGHEYTPDNTYVIPRTGSRSCRACAQDRPRNKRRTVAAQPTQTSKGTTNNEH